MIETYPLYLTVFTLSILGTLTLARKNIYPVRNLFKTLAISTLILSLLFYFTRDYLDIGSDQSRYLSYLKNIDNFGRGDLYVVFKFILIISKYLSQFSGIDPIRILSLIVIYIFLYSIYKFSRSLTNLNSGSKLSSQKRMNLLFSSAILYSILLLSITFLGNYRLCISISLLILSFDGIYNKKYIYSLFVSILIFLCHIVPFLCLILFIFLPENISGLNTLLTLNYTKIRYSKIINISLLSILFIIFIRIRYFDKLLFSITYYLLDANTVSDKIIPIIYSLISLLILYSTINWKNKLEKNQVRNRIYHNKLSNSLIITSIIFPLLTLVSQSQYSGRLFIFIKLLYLISLLSKGSELIMNNESNLKNIDVIILLLIGLISLRTLLTSSIYN